MTWSTSDSSIATVSGGKVTGVKAGTVTITASCGGFSASKEVSVMAVGPKITFSNNSWYPYATTSSDGKIYSVTFPVDISSTLGGRLWGFRPINENDWTGWDWSLSFLDSNGVELLNENGTGNPTDYIYVNYDVAQNTKSITFTATPIPEPETRTLQVIVPYEPNKNMEATDAYTTTIEYTETDLTPGGFLCVGPAGGYYYSMGGSAPMGFETKAGYRYLMSGVTDNDDYLSGYPLVITSSDASFAGDAYPYCYIVTDTEWNYGNNPQAANFYVRASLLEQDDSITIIRCYEPK